MKKIALIAATLTALYATPTLAQTETKKTPNDQYVSIGPVAGVGLNRVGNMGGNNMTVMSGNLGIGMIYARNEHWGWGGQLMVSSEGYDVKYNGTEVKAIPIYLRMPLRAYYFFGDHRNTIRPKLYAGPTFGLKLSETDDMYGRNTEVTAYNNTGTFRTFDVGVNVGTGVNIKLAKAIWLNLDLVYNQGLLDVVDDPADNYNTNQNLSFNAGLLFGLK